ncbi:unnamed protein product [Rodentolepis nana]|uniref:Reverse transcriptase n=1 Tax=Rodentolepis nana TaxID=102285 RepID=A0A0R3THI1_RODNA|nr:unnamed protein product [Rodentolepis nana]
MDPVENTWKLLKKTLAPQFQIVVIPQCDEKRGIAAPTVVKRLTELCLRSLHFHVDLRYWIVDGSRADGKLFVQILDCRKREREVLLLHDSLRRLPSTAEPRLPSLHCSSRSTMQITEEALKTAFVESAA